ncbi:MAG: glycosyltransferase [Acidimicrobiales bacterium]
MTQRLSVIVPVYCNETTLVELKDRVSAAVRTIDDLEAEILFVDDASTDRSWAVIERLASADPSVVGLRLASNVGQLPAMFAGIEHAAGDVLISIDADLEHPPEAIPLLLGTFREGHDFVVAKRVGRSTDSVRTVGSHTIGLLARLLRLPVSDVGSSFMVGTPTVAAEMRRQIEQTGRQMMLPRVFDSVASNPAVVEVEAPIEAQSAYALGNRARLAGEFLAAEVGPVVARKLLLASGAAFVLALRASARKRALALGASLGAAALLGLALPRAYRRDDSQPFFAIAARIGGGFTPQRDY